MKQLHAIWLLVTTGITSLVEVGNMIIDGTKVKFRTAPGPAGIRTALDDSDIVQNLAGNQSDKVPSAAAVKSAVDGAALTVNPNSASYVVITNGQLEVKPLLVTRPLIDPASISLVAALAARTPVYNLANVTNNTADLQAGDSLILPLHTGGLRVFMHNGGVLGTIADFTLVEQPALDTVTVRALLTATNGLTYNATTGVFSADESYLTNALYTFMGGITRDSFSKNVFLGGNLIGGRELVLTTSTFNIRNSRGNGFGLWLDNSSGNTFAKFGDLGISLERNNGGMEFKGLDVNGVTYATPPSTPTNNTLIHKAYVDAQIIANTVGKANVTVNTTAGVWTSVAHNFALTAGNFDCLTVAMWDTAGVGVVAPFRVKNANEIEVLTAEAVTGLKVRMLKTL